MVLRTSNKYEGKYQIFSSFWVVLPDRSAQDLWFLPIPNEKNDGIISYRLLENDYDLVHDLLEIGVILGSSQTNRLTLLRNPLNVIENESYSIIYEIGSAYF